MKKILTLIVGLLASGLALPATAQAGGYRIGYSSIYNSGYHSCGCAIRTKRVVVGFDSYHRPTFRYYRLKTKHRCHRYSSGHRGYHYDHRRHYRNHYQRRQSEYRRRHYTPRGSYGGYSRR